MKANICIYKNWEWYHKETHLTNDNITHIYSCTTMQILKWAMANGVLCDFSDWPNFVEPIDILLGISAAPCCSKSFF